MNNAELTEKCTEMSFLLGMATSLLLDLSKYIVMDEAKRTSIESLLKRMDELYYKDIKNAQEEKHAPGLPCISGTTNSDEIIK